MKYIVMFFLLVSFVGIVYADDKYITVIASSPEKGVDELKTLLENLENNIILTISDITVKELDDGMWEVTRSISIDNNISYFETGVLQTGENGKSKTTISLFINGSTRNEAETNHVLKTEEILSMFSGNTVQLCCIETISKNDKSWGIKSTMTVFSNDIDYLVETAHLLKDDALSITVMEEFDINMPYIVTILGFFFVFIFIYIIISISKDDIRSVVIGGVFGTVLCIITVFYYFSISFIYLVL